jgi:adenosylcobyric acid synthase
MTTALMVWGASSGAGKSLLATALCRWAARQGLDVAPFKAQNMSNNARVVPGLDGAAGELGEIGSAQYFQALAARVPPQVDMNPVLLKPERDTASQVVVQGRVDAALSRLPWRERSARLAAAARQSFERLADRHALIVIEGAGSPAEINLAPQDYVNLGAARWARERGVCRALLVADIDRGGGFAHLHGTWALLPEDLRPLLAGFVFNKFRGDAALLAPGPAQLQALTGVPLLGVLPMKRDHGLPEEDGLYTLHTPRAGPAGGPRVAIVAGPHISNLDEFQPLAAAAAVRWVRHGAELDGADWIVLPGSKQVSGDLAWLRAQGLEAAIVAHARAGRPVLGICGGLQMLGQSLHDPDGVDGQADAGGPRPGLGLLPLATQYAAPKRLRAAPVRFAPMLAAAEADPGPWQALAGLRWPAYEIRCGRTEATSAATTAAARPVLFDAEGAPVGWCGGPAGNVLGIATHGLFEDAGALRALLGPTVRTLDQCFDGLADFIDDHLGASTLRALLHP